MNVRRIQRLTEKSIKFIRNAEKLALRMDERGKEVGSMSKEHDFPHSYIECRICS